MTECAVINVAVYRSSFLSPLRLFFLIVRQGRAAHPCIIKIPPNPPLPKGGWGDFLSRTLTSHLLLSQKLKDDGIDHRWLFPLGDVPGLGDLLERGTWNRLVEFTPHRDG